MGVLSVRACKNIIFQIKTKSTSVYQLAFLTKSGQGEDDSKNHQKNYRQTFKMKFGQDRVLFL